MELQRITSGLEGVQDTGVAVPPSSESPSFTSLYASFFMDQVKQLEARVLGSGFWVSQAVLRLQASQARPQRMVAGYHLGSTFQPNLISADMLLTAP